MLRRLVLTCSVLLTVLVPAGRCAEDQFFDLGGVKVRYVVEGQGEPVLLIHGFTASVEMNWKLPGIIKGLAKDHQVIASNDPKALAAVARGFKELTVSWEKLEANQVPTLALIGEQDPLKKGVDELKGKMANLTITVVKEADHRSAFGRPEFIKTLQEFLAEHHGK